MASTIASTDVPLRRAIENSVSPRSTVWTRCSIDGARVAVAPGVEARVRETGGDETGAVGTGDCGAMGAPSVGLAGMGVLDVFGVFGVLDASGLGPVTAVAWGPMTMMRG